MSLVPFVSRLGQDCPGRMLAACLTAERFKKTRLVFHCRGPQATWSGHVARRTLGRGRIVFDMRGSTGPETLFRLGFPWPQDLPADVELKYQRGVELDRTAIAVADQVLTVSKALSDYAIELGALPDRVRVVPSCVSQLTFDAATRSRLRRAWGVPNEDTPVFVYSGRLGPERLPRHMLQFLAAARRYRPDTRLVLYLYRNDLPDLEGLLSDCGLPSEALVIERASRDEVTASLCGADVGLLFYAPALRYSHGFAIKFPEYLAAGLPVIVNSAVGDLPALIREHGVGWVIEPDSETRSLDKSVETVLGELQRSRAQLRNAALDTCAERYLWSRHILTLRQAYGLDSDSGRSPG